MAAAGLLSVAVSASESGAVLLEDAWVRALRALPPTQKVTAAYLTVSNPGDRPVTITGGSAELAGAVEIHTTREIEGYMRMEQLPHLHLPPGGSLRLAPGGTHLMLLQLERMPVAGETALVCLHLASGKVACTEAAVRKSAAAGRQHNQHQHH
jgi:copper(I)-binding protein